MDDKFHKHHPDVGGGPARAAVFGISDGLVSNVALVMGIAGATDGPDAVRLAGLAGLIAGACSMAAGEYVSMKAQAELLEHELSREERELAARPEFERQELIELYVRRGVSRPTAELVSNELMSDPKRALETHAREELGVDPDNLGSPVGAAAASFGAFCVGAVVPLAPFFFGGGLAAVSASMLLTLVAALVIGFVIASFSGRSRVRAMARQVALTAVAAGVTFGASSLVGTTAF